MPELTVIGCLNLDVVATVSTLPAPGETVTGGVVTRHPGGKGGNQAAAAARLGASVRMVAALGDDPEGDRLAAALRSAGVDVEDVARSQKPTGTALITVDQYGENQIAVCLGANEDTTSTGSGPGGEAVLCQLELGVAHTLEVARRSTGFFALNASPAAPLPNELIERCDLVVVNAQEYAQQPALRSARQVIVTDGGAGARFLRRGSPVAAAPALRVDVISTVGAGDAFCAAAVIGVLLDLPPIDVLSAACAVGAHAVTSMASQPALERYDRYQASAASGSNSSVSMLDGR